MKLQNMKVAAMAAVLGGLASLPGHGQDVFVDLELSLVIDVSGSVSSADYTLQLEGYARAFENASLQAAIGAGPQGRIAANLVQFADSAAQSIPWTLISGPTSANAFAASVRAASRLFDAGTSISAGLDASVATFTNNGFSAQRQVIDVSGDGENNAGRDVTLARDDALAAGIDTINGIVIDDDGNLAELRTHYEENVISPDGFVEEAAGFEDFEPSVLSKLTREITGNDAALPVAATLRFASISLIRTQTQDVGRRLARLRSGVPMTVVQPEPERVVPDAKGGLAKSVITPAPRAKHWEVYGAAYYFTEEGDQQTIYRGVGTLFPLLVVPNYDMDMYGGDVGIEYRINNNWSVGAAFGLSTADIDMSLIGSADIDSIALMPYVSYVRRDVFRNADFYADLLYAYSSQDYDTSRLGGQNGSSDGDANTLELNTGLNLKAGALMHGPYASLRWIDGKMDAYTETGVGAISYPAMDYESLATDLGYQVSYQIQVSGGVLVPHARAAWEHEFKNDPAVISGVPLGALDEDLAVVGAGIGWYASNGWNVGLDYEGRFGSSIQSNYVGLSCAYEF